MSETLIRQIVAPATIEAEDRRRGRPGRGSTTLGRAS